MDRCTTTWYFKDSKAEYICSFSSYLRIDSALNVEIIGYMFAIKLVVVHGCTSLWLDHVSSFILH